MNILGIDFSLNGTGLAIFNGSDVTFSKVFSLKPNNEYPDYIIEIPEFTNWTDKLDWVCEKILSTENVDFICMEEHTGVNYEWMDGYAIIKYLLRKKNLPYITLAPTSLKKYAGTGKADKVQMSYFLRKEYNIDFDFLGDVANNIVDACWLAIVGTEFYKKYIDRINSNLPQHRTDVLFKIAQHYGYEEKKKRGKASNKK